MEMWLFRLEVRRHISSVLEFQLQLQSEKAEWEEVKISQIILLIEIAFCA